MLEENFKGFISYCKVAGFKERSIETLSLRLNEFRKFLKFKRLARIRSITYAHLSAFVAKYKSPSIHNKESTPRRGGIGLTPGRGLFIMQHKIASYTIFALL